MVYEVSSGGIVVRNNFLVLVCDERTDLWGFPKGHVEDGESLEKTAKREIYEETGIEDLLFMGKLGSYVRKINGSGLKKKITLYGVRTEQETLKPINSEVIAEWVLIDEVSERLGYMEDNEFFLRVRDRLNY